MNGAVDAVRPHVVLAESSRQASLALRTGEWKLIVPIVADAEGRPLPDLYGRPRSPEPLLFDLRADPGERHNVHTELPTKAAELRGILDAWCAGMASITGEPDPVRAQGLSLPYAYFMERVFARR